MAFKTAVREKQRLRLALYGPTGGGKTLTTLMLLDFLAGGDVSKWGLLDTEHGSASLYADKYPGFNVDELEVFDADRYIAGISEAEASGLAYLGIDSFTHAWDGDGGILSKVSAFDLESAGSGWNKIKPFEKRVWNRVLTANAHLVVTMRSKNEWLIGTDSRGKQTREIIGLEPIQRKGTEYEFSVVCLMQPHIDDEHKDTGAVKLTIEKTRYEELPRGAWWIFGKDDPAPFQDFAGRVKAAISTGEPLAAASEEDLAKLRALLIEIGREPKRIEDVLAQEAANNDGQVPATYVVKMIERAERKKVDAANTGGAGDEE